MKSASTRLSPGFRTVASSRSPRSAAYSPVRSRMTVGMRRPTSSLHRIAAHVDLPEPVVPRMQRWRLSAFSGIKAGHFGIPLRVRSSSPMQMRCGEDTAGRREEEAGGKEEGG